MLNPPLTPFEQTSDYLRDRGYAVMSPASLGKLIGFDLIELETLKSFWHDLPRDPYLKDGGHYRSRRHGSYQVKHASTLELMPHRAHWQPVTYNALHGGSERWFEPLQASLVSNHVWQAILLKISGLLNSIDPSNQWFIEAHPFRIDTTGGIGRPTPEGAHRDGVDYVAVILVDRIGVKGGETRIFEAQGSIGLRFTLEESWTMLLLNDARMIHETTPIQPIGETGYRDTLVITFRKQGFQEPIGKDQQ